jgi:sugar O-acyltransferase (sialic acid O-acetyltransferase NeuD family)
LVDAQYGLPGDRVNVKPILGGIDWLIAKVGEVKCICGIGAPEVRYRMIKQVEALGASFCTIIHPSIIMSRWVTIGTGSVITAGCILTNQIQIGDHVHLNLDCTVGHDAILQAFVTVSPGVHISGKVTLEEGCFIGTGANIIERRRIGAWSMIGAGSTVIHDVPANATAVGAPAKVIKTRPPGWHRDDQHDTS